ncbi:hypothetical protein OG21DRAFT_1409002, partial [Imleria badia]
MRLANLSHLRAFITEYLAFAMFSHRWGAREIVITDVKKAARGASDFLDGAKKLQEFCCVAAKCGFRWAWADTCCIDEQVYGEKSESLNSMFLWYHNSDLTVVYLGDVEDVEQARRIYHKLPAWTTRGWTLQEMIASKRLRFYSRDWTLLEEADDRDSEEAEKMISISSFKYRARLLDHRESAIWLQWAARRRTEKVEDMAYCLLGIFDVTLPVYYGEGPRAFFRLQEELMKRTGDTSLFDW